MKIYKFTNLNWKTFTVGYYKFDKQGNCYDKGWSLTNPIYLLWKFIISELWSGVKEIFWSMLEIILQFFNIFFKLYKSKDWRFAQYITRNGISTPEELIKHAEKEEGTKYKGVKNK